MPERLPDSYSRPTNHEPTSEAIMKSIKAMKSSHMLLCVLLLVVAIALVASGASGFLVLPLVFCGLMMGAMMWMMMRPRGGNGGDH